MYYTLGSNTFDTYPQTFNTTWNAYVGRLRQAHTIMRAATDYEKRFRTPWTAPFIIYEDGAGRGIDNVRELGEFASFDLDEPGWTLDRINDKLHGFRRVLHTTTKSRPEHQRWRLIVKLDRTYTVAEFAAVWSFFNDLLEGALDPKTKNPNRILYVPAQWQRADNLFVEYDGEEFSVDVIVENYEPREQSIIPPVFELTADHAAPDGTEIITPKMVLTFGTSRPGGRFWHLLIAAATRFKREGWQLSVSDLTDAAMAVSRAYAPSVTRHRPDREAARALGWVEANISTMTPLDRLRNRSRWLLSLSPNVGG